MLYLAIDQHANVRLRRSNILIPQRRILLDELPHQLNTFIILHLNQFDLV